MGCMADTRKWAKRVAAWKASGLTSEAFCRGKSFSAGGLRYWAHKLRGQQSETTRKPVVRIGRVLRRPVAVEVAQTPALGRAAESPVTPASTAERPAAIVVELGSARVAVRPGVDRDTLAAVIEVLGTRGGPQ